MGTDSDGVGAVAHGAKEFHGVVVRVFDAATHDDAGGRERGNPERLFAGAATLGEGAEGDGARARRSRADVVDVVVVEHVGDDDVAVEESVGRRRELADAAVDEQDVGKLALGR